MFMGNDNMQQIDELTWHGQNIPVKTTMIDGQAVGLPVILIDDMSDEFRESFYTWLRDVRIIKVGRASTESYYLDDVEQYLAYEKEQKEHAS